jgi:hypothetical protein
LTEALRKALRRNATLAAVLLVSTAGSAAEYSWQVAGSAQHIESGDALVGDGDALDATYYFRPVDDQIGPYALAPFLNRSSRVSAAIHREDQTETRTLQYYGPPILNLPVSGPLVLVSRIETQGYALSGRHVWRDSGWYAGAGYRGADIDTPSVSMYDSVVDLEGYRVLAGKYLGRTTSLELTWDSATTTNEIANSGAPVRFVVSDVSSDAPTLGRSRMYTLGGELYPTARLGVRFGYGRWEHDTLQDDRYSFSTTWFANRHLALHFSLERRSRREPLSFPDIDDATLRLIGRF